MLEKLSEISARTQAGQFDCTDLIRCAYNLNETDMGIIEQCSNNEERTIKEISNILGKDRSTVHRSLEKLRSCGLCFKERKGGASRGFVDFYRILPKKEILKKAEQNLDICYTQIKKLLAESNGN
ncbi:MAG: ArsR family transcriptional regulator [Candidatus Thermoplasmatota archaeon]|nr:ArsR family transcriptional regulator [Euryarchaeota archaeon]MBU4032280.1 ArsR family transcriptional regulator [Candidatus Thermoplasmatota archaeon]MBU4070893.1 ArsR family transcriptional regulator [Candidatus Thermoplasmatota archaeon]MBU4144785.1 ArsR family transcriptional regulator [Candidatus Thermoplasmatota archaeon]MBU4591457.1 ArsR family transcriptional regulator [Candidatus Thermoplasmatota archaeon]